MGRTGYVGKKVLFPQASISTALTPSNDHRSDMNNPAETAFWIAEPSLAVAMGNRTRSEDEPQQLAPCAWETESDSGASAKTNLSAALDFLERRSNCASSNVSQIDLGQEEEMFEDDEEELGSSEDSTIRSGDSIVDHSRSNPQMIISEYLADPGTVASTDFKSLISNITSSLANPPKHLSTDPVTNPFRHQNLYHKPRPPNVPALNLSDFHSPAPPKPPVVSYSARNPFVPREAWTERQREEDVAEESEEEEESETESESENEREEAEDAVPPLQNLARYGSNSAPTTTRRRAPCAVKYPSTSAFIRMVEAGVFDAGDIVDFDDSEYNGCCTDDETALHCAAARGHMECVQSLLEGGAPVDTLDQAGQTALHMALRRGHLDIALLLITRGCGYNIQDEHGDTPIHIAARFGLLTAVQTLCHLGAAVDLTNADQQTPLHIAAAEDHIEIVRVLCLAGSTVAKKNKDGLSAELVALGKEHIQVAALLAKMKSEAVRDAFMDQLIVLDVPLRRIKLKLFGHCGNGKSRLVQGLQAGDRSSIMGSLIGAVSRRFSDNPHSPSSSSVASTKSKDEGIYGSQSSTNSADSHEAKEQWPHYFYPAPHANYTRGIDVQSVNIPGCGEFSVWEFGGYEPYHVAYDHFVGNTDCIHVVLFNASDATEDQYKQVLYWMNFLKGRVSPSEPIGHCGVNSRRSRVVIVGTHATPDMFEKNAEGDYVSSDCDAMLKTIRLRFQTHFDIHDKLVLLDSTSATCPGMKSLRSYLQKTRESILQRLVKPLSLLESCSTYLAALRKQHADFPVVTWPEFIDYVREEINPLASDAHTRQLIHQLQLIGEVVYLRDESTDQDFVVLVPEWLGTHIIGQLLSAEFMSHGRSSGCYSVDDFAQLFPEIQDPTDLLHILDTLQICAPTDANGDSEYEFPALNLMHPPKDIWQKDRPSYVYGGVRVLPARGMERSLQSTFPRIQVALRRSMHDFQDPMDADLVQWYGCSKMSSGQMEALVRLRGDAVEIQVRGPSELATSCFYFLEDVANLVEQTASEVAPVISLERHFLSPKHLREHVANPATFLPEAIMAMQQQESLTIKNTRDETDELFTEVVCFGSREVAGLLTLGIDVCVSQLQMTTRCELAALLDPPDTMGRDWSILACKLNLTDQLPEVDSSGQSLSRTDQLLAEWSLHSPESATVGRLCAILEELGRPDARDAIYRTVPLYLFEPLDDQGHHLTANVADDCGDSGVVSSSHSSNEAAR
uniref:Non-specific serine/threonine protein kinase n=1 Tax=Steinernema glaseri TaxID=37863 RepID=A0A1I8A483_9BILA